MCIGTNAPGGNAQPTNRSRAIAWIRAPRVDLGRHSSLLLRRRTGHEPAAAAPWSADPEGAAAALLTS